MLEIIEHLEKLGRGEIEPEFTSVGICGQLDGLFEGHLHDLFGANQYLKVLMRWDKYSGDPFYPIPHHILKNPELAYQSTVNPWIGDYGDDRRELCLHLAKELRRNNALNNDWFDYTCDYVYDNYICN